MLDTKIGFAYMDKKHVSIFYKLNHLTDFTKNQ